MLYGDEKDDRDGEGDLKLAHRTRTAKGSLFLLKIGCKAREKGQEEEMKRK